jgi:hypothetical protein
MDFFVRLSAAELRDLVLTHQESAIDMDEGESRFLGPYEAASLLPCIRGYTEWVGLTRPEVSIGWDWTLPDTGELLLDRHSVRTNVMLVDDRGVDSGQRLTVEAVIGTISCSHWQAVVLQALQSA